MELFAEENAVQQSEKKKEISNAKQKKQLNRKGEKNGDWVAKEGNDINREKVGTTVENARIRTEKEKESFDTTEAKVERKKNKYRILLLL